MTITIPHLRLSKNGINTQTLIDIFVMTYIWIPIISASRINPRLNQKSMRNSINALLLYALTLLFFDMWWSSTICRLSLKNLNQCTPAMHRFEEICTVQIVTIENRQSAKYKFKQFCLGFLAQKRGKITSHTSTCQCNIIIRPSIQCITRTA